MSLVVKPSYDIYGSVYIQISKSDAHRALIAAALSKEIKRILFTVQYKQKL